MAFFDEVLASALTDEERRGLQPHVELVAYRGRQTVVFRGEIVSRVFVVQRGALVAEYARRGGAPLVLALTPGDVFGASAALSCAVHEARVRAASDDALVASVPAEAVRALLAANPAFRAAFEERALTRSPVSERS